MAKTKAEQKKIRPSEAIRSLEAYNMAVVGLVSLVEIALKNKSVEDYMVDPLKKSLEAVMEFYSHEEQPEA